MALPLHVWGHAHVLPHLLTLLCNWPPFLQLIRIRVWQLALLIVSGVVAVLLYLSAWAVSCKVLLLLLLLLLELFKTLVKLPVLVTKVVDRTGS